MTDRVRAASAATLGLARACGAGQDYDTAEEAQAMSLCWGDWSENSLALLDAGLLGFEPSVVSDKRRVGDQRALLDWTEALLRFFVNERRESVSRPRLRTSSLAGD